MSKVSTKTLLAAAVFAALAAALPAKAETGAFGRCELKEGAARHALTPAHDGVLTIAVPLPSPQAYQGNTPETIDGGYLYCLGAEIASRGGIGKIVVKNASFESLVTGKELLVRPEHALHVVEIMVAARQSQRTGRRIELTSTFKWPVIT